MLLRTTRLERVMLVAAGLLLMYTVRWADVTGALLVAAAIALQLWRRRRPPRP
jgi:TRAP-type uncharacterized transport system fused permease subunit